jgi:DNA-binding response OmpR family regulator
MPTRILVIDDSPTIRKVVSSILERHGYETTLAADGQSALDTLGMHRHKFDLVLLDFVMPRMNGFQFCRAVRSKQTLARLPIILMSARSDKIRDQFVHQTGAIDAISKPFDAQALLAVIENALRRVQSGKTSAALPPDPSEEVLLEGPSPEDRLREARAAAEVATRIADVVAPALAALSAGTRVDAAQLGTLLSQRLSTDVLRDVAQALSGLDLGDRFALAGDLSIVPMGAVLQMLQLEGQSGVLTVTSGPSEITISLRGGLIDLAQSKGAGDEFRLGRYFAEEGLLTPQEIDALIKREVAGFGAPAGAAPANPATTPLGDIESETEEIPQPRETRLLGELLLESGRINEDQLRVALARQSSELAYEILRWARGRFEFRRRPSPTLAANARLALPVASVLMEGFRRVDEWRALDRSLGNFDEVLACDPTALERSGGDLTRQERQVLFAIDSERTIREIIAYTNLSSFDVCRILVQFLEARLVRRRS